MAKKEIYSSSQEASTEAPCLEKKSKKWHKVRTASLSLAALGACAGIYGQLTETKKDDFLVPAGYTLSVIAAGTAGLSQKKKETVDEKLGKPSKIWSFIKKISFISAITGLIGTIVTHLTEDKGDDKIIPWAAPLSILSGFLAGYAYQKNKEASKNKAPSSRSLEQQEKPYQEKIISQNSILWDVKNNMPLDKNLARTLTDKKLSLDPVKIVRSTLPLFQKFKNMHSRG